MKGDCERRNGSRKKSKMKELRNRRERRMKRRMESRLKRDTRGQRGRVN